MLVLKRHEGDLTHAECTCGNVLTFRVQAIRESPRPRVDVAFHDPDRNFDIRRPERVLRTN